MNVGIEDNHKTYWPERISIEITSPEVRNYSYNNTGLSDKTDIFIKQDSLMHLLQKLFNKGLKEVVLKGGEPILHPGFKDILRFCLQKFEKVIVFSSAFFLDTIQLNYLTRYKDKLVFVIGLLGYKDSTFDYKSGKTGSFEKVMYNIRMLNNMGFCFHTKLKIDDNLTEEVEGTLLLSALMGASTFYYALEKDVDILVNTDFDERFSPCIYKISELDKILTKQYSNYLQLQDHALFQINYKGNSCSRGYCSLVIDVHFNLRACSASNSEVQCFGNLLKEELITIFSYNRMAYCNNGSKNRNRTCDSCLNKQECKYCLGNKLMSDYALQMRGESVTKNDSRKCSSLPI